MSQGDLLHVVTADDISERRKLFGRAIVWGSALIIALVAAAQTVQQPGIADFGCRTWRHTLCA